MWSVTGVRLMYAMLLSSTSLHLGPCLKRLMCHLKLELPWPITSEAWCNPKAAQGAQPGLEALHLAVCRAVHHGVYEVRRQPPQSLLCGQAPGLPRVLRSPAQGATRPGMEVPHTCLPSTGLRCNPKVNAYRPAVGRYPVFPWVLREYGLNQLDLGDPAAFRDLSKPVGALDAKRLERLRQRFADMRGDPEVRAAQPCGALSPDP